MNKLNGIMSKVGIKTGHNGKMYNRECSRKYISASLQRHFNLNWMSRRTRFVVWLTMKWLKLHMETSCKPATNFILHASSN